ncbi:hypothetical protein IWX92DRAFT_359550 [Phyllosticta citricarpa]
MLITLLSFRLLQNFAQILGCWARQVEYELEPFQKATHIKFSTCMEIRTKSTQRQKRPGPSSGQTVAMIMKRYGELSGNTASDGCLNNTPCTPKPRILVMGVLTGHNSKFAT